MMTDVEELVEKKVRELLEEARSGKGVLFEAMKDIIMDNVSVHVVEDSERWDNVEYSRLSVKLSFDDKNFSEDSETISRVEY